MTLLSPHRTVLRPLRGAAAVREALARMRPQVTALIEPIRREQRAETLAAWWGQLTTPALWRPLGASMLLHVAALAALLALHRAPWRDPPPPPIEVELAGDPDARVGPDTGIAWESEAERPAVVALLEARRSASLLDELVVTPGARPRPVERATSARRTPPAAAAPARGAPPAPAAPAASAASEAPPASAAAPPPPVPPLPVPLPRVTQMASTPPVPAPPLPTEPLAPEPAPRAAAAPPPPGATVDRPPAPPSSPLERRPSRAAPPPAPADRAPVPVERSATAAAQAPAAIPASAPAASPESPAPANRADRAYYDAVRERVQQFNHFPELAKYHADGRVIVAFTIGRDGTVLSAAVRRSSGYSFFDKAGLDMVRRASPLPAPPADLTSAALNIELPIRFWYD